MTHDPLCPNEPCTCTPDDYGHEPTCLKKCWCNVIEIVRGTIAKEIEALLDKSGACECFESDWPCYHRGLAASWWIAMGQK